MRLFGSAIDDTLLEIRRSQHLWAHRGDPCGLLLGVDEPIGYDCEPPQFRAFCATGGDGDHDGLWIDDPDQTHSPFFVLLSPSDFGDPVQLLASSTDEWLALVGQRAERSGDVRHRAVQRRRELQLPAVGAGDSNW